ncbi:MAG: 2-amino-4-hydroxy-6-hydroxymethyldihydropteridine diphosphokinase [Bacteroidota bacterium]
MILTKTFLLIGGNLGNRPHNLEKAKGLININIGPLIAESSIYETEPWGFEHEKFFYNQVLEVDTPLAPDSLLEKIHLIENQMGRKREKGRYTARIIDIDILFYNKEAVNSTSLTIPHKALHKRRFVLIPLSEIAPDFIHPVLKKSVNMLLQECSDTGMVKKIIK